MKKVCVFICVKFKWWSKRGLVNILNVCVYVYSIFMFYNIGYIFIMFVMFLKFNVWVNGLVFIKINKR